MMGKLQPYIECMVEFSPAVFQLADGYRTRYANQPPTLPADAGAGSAGSGATASLYDQAFVPPPPDPGVCVRHVGAARGGKTQTPELDKIGDAYLDALKTVTDLARDAHIASDPSNKSGKDAGKHYDPAKAIALHPKLLAAFAAFDRAHNALFELVFKLNHEVHASQLAQRIERDGRNAVNVTDTIMLLAEDLAHYGELSPDRVDQIDLAALTRQLDQIDRQVHELDGIATSDLEDANHVPHLPALLDAIHAFVAAGRQLVVRAQNHVAYSDAEKIMIGARNDAAVIGTPAALLAAYNRMVNGYNQ
jgi:hypothetical protein